MSEQDGGPAFPHATVRETDVLFSDGMSMRDWFAGMTLRSILEYDYNSDPNHELVDDEGNLETWGLRSAKWAYQFADSMLKARGEA